MIVRESISFERGKDPKKAMGIGNAFENLDYGSIIQLIKDDGMEIDQVKAGDLLKIIDTYIDDDGSRSIDYVLINDRGEELDGGYERSWFMSKDFFYEYFDVIKL